MLCNISHIVPLSIFLVHNYSWHHPRIIALILAFSFSWDACFFGFCYKPWPSGQWWNNGCRNLEASHKQSWCRMQTHFVQPLSHGRYDVSDLHQPRLSHNDRKTIFVLLYQSSTVNQFLQQFQIGFETSNIFWVGYKNLTDNWVCICILVYELKFGSHFDNLSKPDCKLYEPTYQTFLLSFADPKWNS